MRFLGTDCVNASTDLLRARSGDQLLECSHRQSLLDDEDTRRQVWRDVLPSMETIQALISCDVYSSVIIFWGIWEFHNL